MGNKNQKHTTKNIKAAPVFAHPGYVLPDLPDAGILSFFMSKESDTLAFLYATIYFFKNCIKHYNIIL